MKAKDTKIRSVWSNDAADESRHVYVYALIFVAFFGPYSARAASSVCALYL